jgi:hypothetical protein
MMPKPVPVCTSEPKNPRRLGGACSVISVTAPPHSPPMPKPWMKRSTTSRMGAATPMLA